MHVLLLFRMVRLARQMSVRLLVLAGLDIAARRGVQGWGWG
jgi:hypothetical protein